ncbi:MAG: hypothetical protein ACREO3_06490 [Arenimonas sp.]
MPAQFIGEWVSDVTKCGSHTDDLALRVEGNLIAYWESRGPIKAVVAHGSDEIAVIAELSDEGYTWLAAIRFRLSAQEDELIDYSTSPGKELIRYRRPAAGD